jgi:type I restriction enzyme M protein
MGQYFTPQTVITFMVEVADPKINEQILDPFSGSGHFLSTSLEWIRRNSQESSKNHLQEFAASHLHGIEKSDRMVRVATTELRLHICFAT